MSKTPQKQAAIALHLLHPTFSPRNIAAPIATRMGMVCNIEDAVANGMSAKAGRKNKGDNVSAINLKMKG